MSWLRRNLVALLVIVVSVPALAFVLVGVPLIDRAQNTTAPVAVKVGDTVDADGYSFTVTASQEFAGTGTGAGTNNIPTGSSLVGVLVDVAPNGDPIADNVPCDPELTSRADGIDRAWRAVSSPRDFDYAIGDDRTTVCILDTVDEPEAFELEQVFLVPAGAYGVVTLDITVGSTTYRFELPRS